MHEVVLGDGPLKCRIAFVGERPGREEAQEGRGFVGKSGVLLWLWAWQYARLRREDVYVANLVPTYDPGNADPTEEEIAEWGPLLVDGLRERGVEVVVAVGRFAARYLTGREYTMETLHGVGWPDCHGLGTMVVSVFHPAGGLRRDNLLAYTGEGLRGLGALLEELPLPRRGGRARYRQLRVWPRNLHLPPSLPLDTEGTPADPWSVQFSLHPGEGCLIAAADARLVRAFAAALARERPALEFHNAQWDIKVLRAIGKLHGVELDVVTLGLRIVDTLIVARNLKVEPYSLKNLARRHLGMKMAEYKVVVGPTEEKFAARYLKKAAGIEWEKEKENPRKHTPGKLATSALKRHMEKQQSLVAWWGEKKQRTTRERIEARLGVGMPKPGFADLPRKRFVRYACRDADAQGRLTPIMLAEARRLGVMRTVELEHAALPLVERMEQIGMKVDVPGFGALATELREVMQDARLVCAELSGDPEFNPTSSEQVGGWCRRRWAEHGDCGITKMTPGGVTSTDDDALKAIRLDHPMIEAVLEYRQAETLLTSYVLPLPELLDEDGVYRPKFGYVRESEEKTAGGRTETGRLKERILTIPVRTELGRKIRKRFRPVYEGWVFVSCDLSQIELRLAAELSGDKEMMAAFVAGKDIHSDSTCKLFGITESAAGFEEKRFTCKTTNFALIYLASARTLYEKFRAEGIEGYDEQATEELRRDWFRLYSGLEPYYKRQIAYAKKHGFVRSKSGRVRFLPGIYCDEPGLKGWPYWYLFDRAMKIAGNHPIQGGVADLVTEVMALLWDLVWEHSGSLWSDKERIEPAVQIHDDLMVQAPREYAEEAGRLLREVMLSKQGEYRVPIEAKVKIGETWGELH